MLAGVAVWRALPAVGALAVAVLAVFAGLVWHHGRLGRLRDRLSLLARLSQESLWRLARDWDRLPDRHDPAPDPAHPYAADLNVLGRASLLQLLDTTTTPMGSATLRDWLLRPAAPLTVRLRQESVRELAPQLDLREELQRRGRSAGAGPDPEPFLAWAEGERVLARRRGLLWCARLSPALLLVLLAAWLLHLVQVPVWLLLVVANGALYLVLGAPAERVLGTLRVHHGAFAAYAGQLGLLAGMAPAARRLRELRSAVSLDGVPAPRLLQRLDTIASLATAPESLQHLPLQFLLLWNVHVLDGLERWQAHAGREARAWLDCLGELEALCALAGLAHANPSWAFPELDEAADELRAAGAGHPLLDPGRRVDNDVTVGPPGSFLLVTGSNMSGKSTLLRTVGTNIVLASAGAPVCAGAFRLPPTLVWTSVGVEDSLERGVSYFLAEVQRLKQIVDAARAATPAGPSAPLLVCYLLDEVLRGTNTAERRIAARGILRVLAHQRAIGMVSTHDLTLAETPEMAAIARLQHFRETVTVGEDGPGMTFDYRLRPGLATSTNALRLLQLMGLELQGDLAAGVSTAPHPRYTDTTFGDDGDG